MDCSITIEDAKERSAAALNAAYTNIAKKKKTSEMHEDSSSKRGTTVDDIVEAVTQERKYEERTRSSFQAMNIHGNDSLSMDEFCAGAQNVA